MSPNGGWRESEQIPALAPAACLILGASEQRGNPSVSEPSAVGASWPAARTPHAVVHLIYPDLDAAPTGGILLGRSHPADPLVARQRREGRPEIPGGDIRLDRPSEISRQLMHCAVCEFLHWHTSKRVGFRSPSKTRHYLNWRGSRFGRKRDRHRRRLRRLVRSFHVWRDSGNALRTHRSTRAASVLRERQHRVSTGGV